MKGSISNGELLAEIRVRFGPWDVELDILPRVNWQIPDVLHDLLADSLVSGLALEIPVYGIPCALGLSGYSFFISSCRARMRLNWPWV